MGKGYCCFSDYIESANDHLQWQKGSANPELVTIKYAGTVAMEIICESTAGITSVGGGLTWLI